MTAPPADHLGLARPACEVCRRAHATSEATSRAAHPSDPRAVMRVCDDLECRAAAARAVEARTTADPWLSGYCDNCLAPLRHERGRFFRYVCCSCDRDGCDACMPDGGTVPCPECCAEAGLNCPDPMVACVCRSSAPAEPPGDHLGLLRDPETPATPEERRVRARARARAQDAVLEHVTAQPSAHGMRLAITRTRATNIDCGRHVSAQPDEDTVALCDPGAWIDPEERGS